MATSMIRIDLRTRERLRELSDRNREPMQAVLAKAVEEYRRNHFFEALDEAYAALQADPNAWSAELQERAELDGTLMDGLDLEETWSGDGRPVRRAKARRR